MKPGGSKAGLRTVAILEATKGLLVLLVGFGLPGITQHKTARLMEQIVRKFRLNPAHHVPRVFEQLAQKLDNTHLWVLAVTAGTYAAIRFAEAYGLWYQRRWAEWVGFVGAAIYVPMEIWHLVRHHSWVTFWVLVANLAIVIYLGSCLRSGYRRRKQEEALAASSGEPQSPIERQP